MMGSWPANPDGTYPRPKTTEEMARFLSDPMARICSGFLYRIMAKETDADDNGKEIPFVPNLAQRRLIARLHFRNLILKARQLGFTTLVCILWLDHALFNKDQRCVLVAQDLPKATEIFRDKVKYAYDRLPDSIKGAVPAVEANKTELLLANNSSFKITTSTRSGTVDRLHISEMGKIGAKFPHKAKEIVTGSFPAVPLGGIIVVESTAEGQAGEFYRISKRAQELDQAGTPLTPKDFRFHFFPWWQEPAYRIADGHVVETPQDAEYFAEVEADMRITLDREQRNWYLATRAADFSDDEEKMWQEYPSTPEEAFKVSTEGTYYHKQLAAARKQKRIGFFPAVDGVPVCSFWDIGASDGTGIWLMQQIGQEHRFIEYLENWGEGYSYYTGELQKRGYTWDTHYVPHDAGHKKQQGETVEPAVDTLRKSGIGGTWTVVPRVDDINHGINLTRAAFSKCTFNEATTKEGVVHLQNYRKEWDENHGTWKLKPAHDEHSEACFVAGTLIETGRGAVPIEDVTTNDVVRTPLGFSAVYDAGPTRMADDLIEVETEDGTVLECTPTHKIFTRRGLVMAQELVEGDVILTSASPLYQLLPWGFRDSFLRVRALLSRLHSLLHRQGHQAPSVGHEEAQPLSPAAGEKAR